MRVYLSGGFTGWQEDVIAALGRTHHIVNPMDNEDIKDPNVYVPLDLYYVRQCDIVLAYLEKDNPSGVGLACEIACAFGLGKTVVLVNEKSDDRYWMFLNGVAHFLCDTLSEATELVRRM